MNDDYELLGKVKGLIHGDPTWDVNPGMISNGFSGGISDGWTDR